MIFQSAENEPFLEANPQESGLVKGVRKRHTTDAHTHPRTHARTDTRPKPENGASNRPTVLRFEVSKVAHLAVRAGEQKCDSKSGISIAD